MTVIYQYPSATRDQVVSALEASAIGLLRARNNAYAQQGDYLNGAYFDATAQAVNLALLAIDHAESEDAA